ncbi:NAD(P)/FAD-dependent oxidoreductase [Corynebacterium freiburgense]|uniref:NAD(P)/FAD-dependent oxidoreductase n=1 Tax=Corynebacterium freiburgense TaxID=556548 RepID=UPI00041D62E2|nr:NAD(P)/FAD-dependent oxidoreductase [Corynebacterium freiburgense]WJZ02244.1 Thioredoxin reductase [Corynebacterium freiburgense]
MTVFDVAIIGGGPAGLSAALVLGRQQRHVLLVDSSDPRNAPAPEMHMYLTRDGISPHDFLRLGRAELNEYPGIERRTATVERITGELGNFEITFNGRTATAKYLLLATGQHDQLGGLSGLSERWGNGVYHCSYCHGFESTDATIGVLVSRPLDVFIARYLLDRFSQDVIVFTQGIEVEADDLITVDTPVIRISGAEPELLLHLENGETVVRNRIFYRPDAVQSNRFAESLGCEISEDWKTIMVDAQHQSSVPGVYAVGDCSMNRDAFAPLGFVAAGVGEGQCAGICIDQQLFMASLSATD